MYKTAKKIISLFLMGIILINSFCPIRAKASSDNDPKTVRVGYYQNEAFQDGASDDAVKKGYSYEYYRKLSEYTGWKYEYVYGDFVTIYNMLLDGEVDLVAGLAYTEERDGQILYPDRAMGSESYGIVKHENDFSLTVSPSSLNDRTIGVLDSAIVTTLNNYLSEENITANVVLFNDYEKLLDAFDKKEVDVIAAEIDGIYDRYHAEVLYSFGGSDYYLCVNKNRPDLLDDLNQAQSQLFADNPDYLSYLRNQYYLTALSSRAFTTSEYDWLAENNELKIGYLNNYLPYSDTDRSGKPTGMVKDLFPEIFRALGIDTVQFGYQGYDNYDDMVNAVSSGDIDVAFPVGGGLFYSEEDGLLLSNPVTSSLTDIVYNSKHFDSNLSDFAVNKNNKLQYYYVMNNYPDSRVQMYDSIEECLQAVENGEVSYTTVNGLRTNSIMKKGDYDNLSFLQLYHKDDTNLGVKIGNHGLLKLLNRGIGILGSDYAQNIAFRYSENMNAFTLRYFLRNYLWLVLCVFLIIAVLIVLLLAREIANNKKRITQAESTRLEIENANREKFIFVNKMANYMREPLRNLGNLIGFAKNSNDMGTVKESLGGMSSYTKELMSIINNILNMSRVESGQIHLEDGNISRHLYGKRILMVEDTTQNQMITSKILKQFGFEIQVANSGKEAYDILNAAPTDYFDAIILDADINSGKELEDAVKIRTIQNDSRADIAIIAMASDETDYLNSCLEDHKISGLIKKPYDIDSMTELFTDIFNRTEDNA